MKAVTGAEMREVDRLTTERFGIPSVQLMEAAGKHVADAVLREFSPQLPRRVAVLCGKGNNGGDGLVAARYLRAAGVAPRVCLFGNPKELHGDAGANLARYLETGATIIAIEDEAAWQRAWPAIADSEVMVDALLGTGLRGAATGQLAQAIEAINRLSAQATAARPTLILAGRGAVRGGAGLVTIAAPGVALPRIGGGKPEYMSESLESTDEGTIAVSNLEGTGFGEILKGKEELRFGPGLGLNLVCRLLL